MSALEDLRHTIARLRGPGGCPWDQEQTHATLVRCLIDEVSELIETIDRGDYPHMREELGDVLIQVVFHARIAAELGHFNFDDVARDINDKLVRRHPHVFGEGRLDSEPTTPALGCARPASSMQRTVLEVPSVIALNLRLGSQARNPCTVMAMRRAVVTGRVPFGSVAPAEPSSMSETAMNM